MDRKEFFEQAKVGDRISLRKDLQYNCKYGSDFYVAGMPKPGTENSVIVKLYPKSGRFKVNNSLYNFTPEMVASICNTEQSSVTGLRVGDVVRFRDDLKDGKHIEGTSLTFFAEGPVKAGCTAIVEEAFPYSHEKDSNEVVVFKVKGSPYYYDRGMLADSVDEKAPEVVKDTPMVVKEKIVQSVLDRIKDKEDVLNFLDRMLKEGCVVKIRKDIDKADKYWGCNYLRDCMLAADRTAKISESIGESILTQGDRFYLDKDRKGWVYSTPMFDMTYCITRNPSIYKEFLATFDVDEVTEKKPVSENRDALEILKEILDRMHTLEELLSKR